MSLLERTSTIIIHHDEPAPVYLNGIINRLPQEIMHHIFLQLTLRDLFAVSHTCRHWRNCTKISGNRKNILSVLWESINLNYIQVIPFIFAEVEWRGNNLEQERIIGNNLSFLKKDLANGSTNTYIGLLAMLSRVTNTWDVFFLNCQRNSSSNRLPVLFCEAVAKTNACSLEILWEATRAYATIQVPPFITDPWQKARCIHNAMTHAALELEAVSNIQITDQPLPICPAEIGFFPNLQHLSLENCKMWMLSEQIDLLFNLEILNLSHNKLFSIPEISSLIKLKTLNISHNDFREFPLTILSLTVLENLDCSYNKLNKIPVENLSVKFLDISRNPLKESEDIGIA